ncbi:MAG: FAD-binding oxidoreductase, partial [Myxococcota bacterium]
MTSSPQPPETPQKGGAALSRKADDLAARLAARFGADGVSTAGLADLAPDGCTPRALLLPASAAETAAVLAYARAEQLRVAPVGGGTRRSAGGLPRGIDLLLSTARLNRIVDYAPADFVITAEAGVTLENLRSATAPNGQWLALDPPARAGATLGGALSVDASGPHRYLYGTARDLVVGLEAALPNGDVVRSGGRVVKNVAGYDLKKIFLGALGTLGVITSVSIKLHAIPEDETLIVASFPDYPCAADATAALLRAGYEIAALDLVTREVLEALGPAVIPDETGCGLLLSLTGTPASNSAQASE